MDIFLLLLLLFINAEVTSLKTNQYENKRILSHPPVLRQYENIHIFILLMPVSQIGLSAIQK
jgi:hypothetical protein